MLSFLASLPPPTSPSTSNQSLNGNVSLLLDQKSQVPKNSSFSRMIEVWIKSRVKEVVGGGWDELLMTFYGRYLAWCTVGMQESRAECIWWRMAIGSPTAVVMNSLWELSVIISFSPLPPLSLFPSPPPPLSSLSPLPSPSLRPSLTLKHVASLPSAIKKSTIPVYNGNYLHYIFSTTPHPLLVANLLRYCLTYHCELDVVREIAKQLKTTEDGLSGADISQRMVVHTTIVGRYGILPSTSFFSFSFQFSFFFFFFFFFVYFYLCILLCRISSIILYAIHIRCFGGCWQGRWDYHFPWALRILFVLSPFFLTSSFLLLPFYIFL